MGGSFRDYGLVTTPQIHYLVSLLNKSPKEFIKLEKYYEDFADFFNTFFAKIGKYKNNIGRIFIYCADVIGGARFDDFNKYVKLDIKIINSGIGDKVYLNDLCGAEFVKKQRKLPRNFEEVPIGGKCISFDGDADRIVYL